MFDEHARQFLQKALIARFSTIDSDGYPHTVPVWYMLDGDDIVMISVESTRKMGYIRANPKGAITIGGDSQDGGGYLIKGDCSIEPDPYQAWVKKMSYHYDPPEVAAKNVIEWADLNIQVIRLKPRKVIKVA